MLEVLWVDVFERPQFRSGRIEAARPVPVLVLQHIIEKPEEDRSP